MYSTVLKGKFPMQEKYALNKSWTIIPTLSSLQVYGSLLSISPIKPCCEKEKETETVFGLGHRFVPKIIKMRFRKIFSHGSVLGSLGKLSSLG